MASENLLSIELNAQELQQIDRALSDLEMVTQNKFINLTPDERKEYSRIGHKTEDWIVRVKNLYGAISRTGDETYRYDGIL